jgi:hypothetical protein
VCLHDNKGRLHARLEQSQQEANCHEARKVLGCSRTSNNDAPAEDVGSQILGDGKFLEQQVGRVFADEDPHVEDRAKPAVHMSNGVSAFYKTACGHEETVIILNYLYCDPELFKCASVLMPMTDAKPRVPLSRDWQK